MLLSRSGEDAYFAASNSKSGFYSYYRECFDHARVDRVYAVKGGPGTGKSRFLREVARYAEVRGWKSEYIYCSSDPDSLDGVILSSAENCMALLDATSPHVYEPTRPGVREELVNLGAFWDSKRLSERAARISELNEKKTAAYTRAYRYLASVGEMAAVRDALVSPYVKRSAVRAYAEKLLREVPRGSGYSVQTTLLRGVGMGGSVCLSSAFERASRTVLVQDCRGSAQYLMQALGELAVLRAQPVRLSHDPICPDLIDGIIFTELGLCVAVGNYEEIPNPAKTVVMRRFLETVRMRAVKEQIKYADRMRSAMLDGAIEALGEVRGVHFALEELYMAAMDFSAKEAFTKKFCERVFDLQNP